MTIGVHQVAWYWELVLAWLALTGAGVLAWEAAKRLWSGLWRVVYWLRWERVEDDDQDNDDGDDEPPPPLPPERTEAQLGFVRPPESPEVSMFRRLERERVQRWTDVEEACWAAYDALGLEGTGFTRAMARQVRELAP